MNTNSQSCELNEIMRTLDCIRDLLVLQIQFRRKEMEFWLKVTFGKSKILKHVYAAVDGTRSAGEIAAVTGIGQKHVSTALTKLHTLGMLDAVKPYKRGYIYRTKPSHNLLGLKEMLELLMKPRKGVTSQETAEESDAQD